MGGLCCLNKKFGRRTHLFPRQKGFLLLRFSMVDSAVSIRKCADREVRDGMDTI